MLRPTTGRDRHGHTFPECLAMEFRTSTAFLDAVFYKWLLDIFDGERAVRHRKRRHTTDCPVASSTFGRHYYRSHERYVA